MVHGVGTAVLFRSGLSAVIESIEDMPSDQSDSSSSESDLSDDGGSGGVKEQKKVYILKLQNEPVAGGYQIQEWRPADLHRFASAAARLASAAARRQVEERHQLPGSTVGSIEDMPSEMSLDFEAEAGIRSRSRSSSSSSSSSSILL